MMAFLPYAPVLSWRGSSIAVSPRHPHPHHRHLPCRLARRPALATASSEGQSPSPSGETPTATSPSSAITIPSSLTDAATQATTACDLAFSRGIRRVFIEVDLTAGDATYTLLKSTLPLVQLLLPLLDSPDADPQQRVHLLFPDAGAAALARRDFTSLPSHIVLSGIEQAEIDAAEDSGLIIVAPRASDVESLCEVVDEAGDMRIAVVNPDLVDMGVTGLSLNARRLRQRLIDTFESSYYLKTFDWGVLLRAYPGTWGVWVDAPGTDIGFRLVGELGSRPGPDQIDEVLEGDEEGQGMIASPFAKFKRFLSLYMKG